MSAEFFFVDVNVWSHPKIVGLSDAQFALLIRGWAYAAGHNTGGRITKAGLKLIRGTSRSAEALVDASLWHREGEGWRFHDWDEHQASLISYLDAKVKARDRKRLQRARERTTEEPPERPPEPGGVT